MIFIAILTIFASGIGTLTGFGISTVMVPVLIFFLPIGQVLLLVALIHLLGELSKLMLFRESIRWRMVLWFAVPGLIGSLVGAVLSFTVPEDFVARLLGILLMADVLFLYTHKQNKIHMRDHKVVAAGGGVLSGFFAGITGIGGPIRVAFLSIFKLKKEVFIATTGLASLFVDFTRIGAYFGGGIRLDSMMWWGFLMFIPAAYWGSWLARRYVKIISYPKMQVIISGFLIVIALKLLIFG